MERRAVLLALLLPVPALAQTLTITDSSGSASPTINIAQCEGTASKSFNFSWTVTSTTTAATFNLEASDTSGCPDATSSNNAHTKALGTSITASNNSGVYPSSGTVNAATTLLPGLNIQCRGAQTPVYICVRSFDASGAQISATAATATITVDGAQPAPPTGVVVTPGDSALNVSWSSSSSSADGGTSGVASSYRVVATSTVDGTTKTQTVTGTSARIEGLTIGTTYAVTVVAISTGGNESDPSAAVNGTPVQVDDFWRLYKSAGGREQGGCSTGAAGLLALVGAAFALRALSGRRS
jgi:hypothetical protein